MPQTRPATVLTNANSFVVPVNLYITTTAYVAVPKTAWCAGGEKDIPQARPPHAPSTEMTGNVLTVGLINFRSRQRVVLGLEHDGVGDVGLEILLKP
jgi:hypothetical protein